MALEAVFQDLCQQCQKLHEAMSALRLTIVEDKPLTGDIMLIEQFSNSVDDILGWLEEVYSAAAEGRQAVRSPLDLERARHALLSGHERCNHLMQKFFLELLCHDRIAELLNVGRERRGEWQAWAQSVKGAIEGCQSSFYDVQSALFKCWQELAERFDMSPVSAQTTSMRQTVAVPGSTGLPGRSTSRRAT